METASAMAADNARPVRRFEAAPLARGGREIASAMDSRSIPKL
jgi:hypothetical protein